ncbi:hypothetical protein [Bacilliculturomica massiliensis]|uniref:hypothetical protein n=1 Tax=Bacilliculturomica massiliensis TaxID=1917867 RepID=UPI001030A969|nr:hypothetical protein [Bacilliculturomica massiliensis]
MNRKKALIRNLALTAGCTLLIYTVSGFFFVPESAFRVSERSSHYGPSEIVCVGDAGSAQYFFGSFENYISLTEIKRYYLPVLWTIGNQYLGHRRDLSQALDPQYSSHVLSDGLSSAGAGRRVIVYGYVNDPSVTLLELNYGDGHVLRLDLPDPDGGSSAQSLQRRVLLPGDAAAAAALPSDNGVFFLFCFIQPPDSSAVMYYRWLRGLSSDQTLLYEYSPQTGVTIPPPDSSS